MGPAGPAQAREAQTRDGTSGQADEQQREREREG